MSFVHLQRVWHSAWLAHPDDWKWNEGDHFAWREHEGRGYWHNHNWADF